jgi:hypothetical protein
MEQDTPNLYGTSQLAKKPKINFPVTFNIPTSNPFTPLDREEEQSLQIQSHQDNATKLPPIYINNLNNINIMLKDINELNPGPYKHITINNKLKSNINTITGQRTIITYLQSKNAEYHTYQFRVVIRGLHPSCDMGLMMEELRGLRFEPTQMLSVHHFLTKVPMRLFFLDLKPSPNNINIYELTRLYGGVIIYKPPKPKRTIVQCTKCQRFGQKKVLFSSGPNLMQRNVH